MNTLSQCKSKNLLQGSICCGCRKPQISADLFKQSNKLIVIINVV